MLGLSVAILCLENQYETHHSETERGLIRVLKTPLPAPPYSSTWENPEGQDGLYRIENRLYNVIHQIYENDTMYVTIQVNSVADKRFSELSELMEEVITDKNASSPLSRAIKLLNSLLKVYLPISATALEYDSNADDWSLKACYTTLSSEVTSEAPPLQSPPPEFS